MAEVLFIVQGSTFCHECVLFALSTTHPDLGDDEHLLLDTPEEVWELLKDHPSNVSTTEDGLMCETCLNFAE